MILNIIIAFCSSLHSARVSQLRFVSICVTHGMMGEVIHHAQILLLASDFFLYHIDILLCVCMVTK